MARLSPPPAGLATTRALSRTRLAVVVVIPLSLLAFSTWVVQSTAFELNPSGLSRGVTLDLLITLPLIYLLLIWNTSVPKITVVSVGVVSTLAARVIVPAAQQGMLTTWSSFAIPAVEVGVVGYVGLRVASLLRRARARIGTPKTDAYDALRTACEEVLPRRAAVLLATEIAVFYYAFIVRKRSEFGSNEFTNHRRSAAAATLGGFAAILVIEATAVHLILQSWSHLLAWILTAGSLYAALQCFALARSLSHRPIVVTDQGLRLRYGFGAEAELPLSTICGVELTRRSLPSKEGNQWLSPLAGFDTSNVRIHTREPCVLRGLYGIERRFTTLALHLDDADRFKGFLELRCDLRATETDRP